MRGVRVFLLFSVILLAILAVLGVTEIVSPEKLWDIGGKLIAVLFILGLASFAIVKLANGNSKSISSSEDERIRKQGPKF